MGCEKEALALFMKIDSRRKQSKQETEMAIVETPKFKGMHEIKGLFFNLKFKESGSACRNRGNRQSKIIHEC